MVTSSRRPRWVCTRKLSQPLLPLDSTGPLMTISASLSVGLVVEDPPPPRYSWKYIKTSVTLPSYSTILSLVRQWSLTHLHLSLCGLQQQPEKWQPPHSHNYTLCCQLHHPCQWHQFTIWLQHVVWLSSVKGWTVKFNIMTLYFCLMINNQWRSMPCINTG